MDTPRFTPALIMACIGALVGCSAGPKNFDNENDELRRKLTTAEERIAALEAERSELAAKVTELTRTFEGMEGTPSADVVASLPRCAGITIGRLSGPRDSDEDGLYDTIDLYIRPFDGRQRFIQIAGQMSLSATLIPAAGSSAQPRTLGSAVKTPYDIREAYRSSPLGTHYTMSIPIPPTAPGALGGADGSAGSVVLSAEFQDAVTGQVHKAQSTVTPAGVASPAETGSGNGD